MVHGFKFSELVVLANASFYIFKCQEFSHSSIPGTYTLGVRHTLNKTDSDVNCSRSCDQGKNHKKGLEDIYFTFN